MKGLKLPGETESKDEESQMYLKNNLNQIKIFFFFDIYDKYQRFFDHITDEEKKSIDYKTLSFKVKGINFFNNYGTLYEQLNQLLESEAAEASKKVKSFLEDPSKGFKFKATYATTRKGL